MGRNSGRLRQKIKEHKFQYKIKMKTLTSNKAFWLLLVICVVTILPFLGLSEYHTKGEPRESIVSYSMLDSGNWILPRNNGGEMAYKPPFFHWSIAAVSAAVNGGQVTEMTSRLPSAIALIAMTLCGFLFFAKRKGVELALLAAFITFYFFCHFSLPPCGIVGIKSLPLNPSSLLLKSQVQPEFHGRTIPH